MLVRLKEKSREGLFQTSQIIGRSEADLPYWRGYVRSFVLGNK